MRVNDRSSHGANGNALTHGLPAHEVVGFFFVQIALFHEDTFCALNAAKGPQGFVELVDSRSQPLLVQKLRPRNGETGQDGSRGKWLMQHRMRRAIAQQLQLRHLHGLCHYYQRSLRLPWNPRQQLRQLGSELAENDVDRFRQSQRPHAAHAAARAGEFAREHFRVLVAGNSDRDLQRRCLRRGARRFSLWPGAGRHSMLRIFHARSARALTSPRPTRNGSAQTGIADCCMISNWPLRSTRPTRDHKSVWLVAALTDIRPCGASKSEPNTLPLMRSVSSEFVCANALEKR